MLETLAFILIVLPFLAAVGCFVVRASAVRSFIIVATSGLLVVAFIALLFQAPVTFSPETVLGLPVRGVIHIAEYLLLALILFYGVRYKSALIIVFALMQAGLAVALYFMESGAAHAAAYPTFVIDNLALVMVAIITVVGGAIAVHAIPYMKAHEEHLHLEKSRQPQFFLVLVLFLGAMNGLVLSNDISFFYFFWEVTTLCSFLLIGHDQTEIAIKNAVRALWMNSLGGVALLGAIVWFYKDLGTFDIAAIIKASPNTAMMMVPMALLCFGGFTKAAQVPFQSWLLGAMVAPTPVSAMLHSSTMVKAGVYALVRFAPAFAGTLLGDGVALCGAFTFLATAALAVGQSNGKKILAYSTISNLGLIVACSGIGTSAALTAAMLIIIFHAVSKGLLFLCVGTIEQHIGSRDIEDMRGVYARMPVTSLITVIAILTMILPPFGMLLGKWMAVESAATNLPLIIMLALGSALTVLYWARWAGSVMSAPFRGKITFEVQPILTRWPLVGLCVGAVVVSFAAPWLYTGLIEPAVASLGPAPFTVANGVFDYAAGGFAVVPLFLVVIVGFVFAIKAMRKTEVTAAAAPYFGGANTADSGGYIGPMNKPVPVAVSHYYMTALFGEEKLSRWVNGAAVLLLALMFAMGGMQ